MHDTKFHELNHTIRDVWTANSGVFPGFHTVRHLLALTIFSFHCYLVLKAGAGDPEIVPTIPDAVAGVSPSAPDHFFYFRPFLFALVAGFFALSGFLVAGSAERNSHVGKFLGLRLIRIVPALSVEVVLSALLLGPLLTSFSLYEYFCDESFYRYFGNVLGIVHFNLPGVFADNPWQNMVNINLWTLPGEFYSYLIMAALLFIGFSRKSTPLLFVIAFFAILLFVGYHLDFIRLRSNNTHFSTIMIVYAFLCGVFLFNHSDSIPLSHGLFIAAAGLYYVLMLTAQADVLAVFLLAYCVVYVGSLKWIDVSSSFKLDLSYGIYLYGFPIQQTYVKFFPSISPVALFIVGISTTLVFSVASWTLIEKPALKLKRLFV